MALGPAAEGRDLEWPREKSHTLPQASSQPPGALAGGAEGRQQASTAAGDCCVVRAVEAEARQAGVGYSWRRAPGSRQRRCPLLHNSHCWDEAHIYSGGHRRRWWKSVCLHTGHVCFTSMRLLTQKGIRQQPRKHLPPRAQCPVSTGCPFCLRPSLRGQPQHLARGRSLQGPTTFRATHPTTQRPRHSTQERMPGTGVVLVMT